MNRKPIFDAARVARPQLTQVKSICSTRLATSPRRAITTPTPTAAAGIRDACPAADRGSHWSASLSEEFERRARPRHGVERATDPGGVSYGLYQLASKTGSCAAFMRNEGAAAARFRRQRAGWRGLLRRLEAVAGEPKDFGLAQHAFIERTR